MRLLTCFTLFVVLMTAGHVAAEDKDTRTFWAYEGGWFAKGKDGSWYEMNETLFRTTSKPAKYGEAKRTKDFIDLYDDSRRKYVRLFEKHAEVLSRKGDWEKALTGRWKAPE